MNFNYAVKKLAIVYALVAILFLIISIYRNGLYDFFSPEGVKIAVLFMVIVAPLVAVSKSYGGIDSNVITATGGRQAAYFILSLLATPVLFGIFYIFGAFN